MPQLMKKSIRGEKVPFCSKSPERVIVAMGLSLEHLEPGSQSSRCLWHLFLPEVCCLNPDEIQLSHSAKCAEKLDEKVTLLLAVMSTK